jgi:hypothetical protein
MAAAIETIKVGEHVLAHLHFNSLPELPQLLQERIAAPCAYNVW